MALDRSTLESRIAESARVVASLRDQADNLEAVARLVASALAGGGVVYTCGNGGSAAEALHMAEELIGKYRRQRRPLAAVCLNADPTAITCIANDFGFEHVFERQVEALARSGDVVVGFSTSGASPNVLAALRAARSGGARTVGLLGRDGGACLAECDAALVVGSSDTAHVQEAHQVAMHLILEWLESE